ncbi:hypothetical protein [Amycolatopsis sp. NPDC059021]|uniref:hypothetical protein n=1 Tax=Amycolatopsis sp. NPDC059021 TaxID=3346704 RepID=UPI00366CE926
MNEAEKDAAVDGVESSESKPPNPVTEEVIVPLAGRFNREPDTPVFNATMDALADQLPALAEEIETPDSSDGEQD